jgi:hypothetical protein
VARKLEAGWRSGAGEGRREGRRREEEKKERKEREKGKEKEDSKREKEGGVASASIAAVTAVGRPYSRVIRALREENEEWDRGWIRCRSERVRVRVKRASSAERFWTGMS